MSGLLGRAGRAWRGCRRGRKANTRTGTWTRSRASMMRTVFRSPRSLGHPTSRASNSCSSPPGSPVLQAWWSDMHHSHCLAAYENTPCVVKCMSHPSFSFLALYLLPPFPFSFFSLTFDFMILFVPLKSSLSHLYPASLSVRNRGVEVIYNGIPIPSWTSFKSPSLSHTMHLGFCSLTNTLRQPRLMTTPFSCHSVSLARRHDSLITMSSYISSLSQLRTWTYVRINRHQAQGVDTHLRGVHQELGTPPIASGLSIDYLSTFSILHIL